MIRTKEHATAESCAKRAARASWASILVSVLGVAVAASCGQVANEGTDGSSHWLQTCTSDADCGGA
jgi:hypothetical protein